MTFKEAKFNVALFPALTDTERLAMCSAIIEIQYRKFSNTCAGSIVNYDAIRLIRLISASSPANHPSIYTGLANTLTGVDTITKIKFYRTLVKHYNDLVVTNGFLCNFLTDIQREVLKKLFIKR